MQLVEFLVYVLSCLGVWFGVSVLNLNPLRIAKLWKDRRRRSARTSSTPTLQRQIQILVPRNPVSRKCSRVLLVAIHRFYFSRFDKSLLQLCYDFSAFPSFRCSSAGRLVRRFSAQFESASNC